MTKYLITRSDSQSKVEVDCKGFRFQDEFVVFYSESGDVYTLPKNKVSAIKMA